MLRVRPITVSKILGASSRRQLLAKAFIANSRVNGSLHSLIAEMANAPTNVKYGNDAKMDPGHRADSIDYLGHRQDNNSRNSFNPPSHRSSGLRSTARQAR